jgi:hypothetical protein
MSDPVAGLLEGLLEGGQTGYTFRAGINERKRRARLDEELMTLRQLEEQRAEHADQRAAEQADRERITFNEQDAERQRVQGLRTEVGKYLSAPPAYATPGEYLSGKQPSRRNFALDEQGRTAMEVGRTLGRVTGADLNDTESLLAGAGMIPSSALAPKGYQPRTREEYLGNQKELAGYRARALAANRVGIRPMTRQQAEAVVDKLDSSYSEWGPTGITKHYVSPADRERMVQKMMDGSMTEDDMPDLPEDAPAGGHSSTAPAPGAGDGKGLVPRVWDYLFGAGSSGGSPTAPVAASPTPGRPSPGRPVPPTAAGGNPTDRASRIQQARALIAQYRDVPQDQLEAALADEGFTDEDIREVLGAPGP